MKAIEVSPTNSQLREMISQARGGAVVLTEDGKPVATLVLVEGADAESLSLSTNPRFLDILRKSFDELAAGRRTSLADVRKRLGLARKRGGRPK